MLGPLPVDIQRQPSDLNIEETGATYLENALLKAQAAAERTKTWSIADDSGLEVDALNGKPGIYSARFAPTNEQKIKKLLAALAETPYRSARFCSVMVHCDPEGTFVKDAEGICWGELLKEPAYAAGEFDSLLWIRETKCTYGELNQEQLSRFGSRGKAARGLSPCLRQRLGLDL